MIIFRAVNIYPGQVDHVLSGIEGIGSEYQIVLDRGEDGRDYMRIKVEAAQGADATQFEDLENRISREVKNQIMVSVKAEMVAYGILPRSEGKSKRVIDNWEE